MPAAINPAVVDQSDESPQVKTPTCLDRTQILDATARVLREKGYDGTTIRTIAKQLDCAVGSIYRYFKDKRQLLDAVCQRRFDAVAEHAELRSPISKTALMYARVAAEQPEQYRLMFWLASIGKQQQSEALPAIVRRILAGWTESLGDQAAARKTWAALHGAINLGLAPDQILTLLDLPAHAGDAEVAESAKLKLADVDAEASF
ncbi:MAG: TetR/AcrR family transcriptional regulator [Planctomycetota bacterium]